MNLSPTNLNKKCRKYGENSIYTLRYGVYCIGFHKTHEWPRASYANLLYQFSPQSETKYGVYVEIHWDL